MMKFDIRKLYFNVHDVTALTHRQVHLKTVCISTIRFINVRKTNSDHIDTQWCHCRFAVCFDCDHKAIPKYYSLLWMLNSWWLIDMHRLFPHLNLQVRLPRKRTCLCFLKGYGQGILSFCMYSIVSKPTAGSMFCLFLSCFTGRH